MSMMKTTSLIAACASLLFAGSSQAVLSWSDDFNSYADGDNLRDDVAVWNGTAASFVVDDDGGLSGSGAINTPSTSDRRALRNDVSGNLADGAITGRVYLKPDTSDSGLVELSLFTTDVASSSRSGLRVTLSTGNDGYLEISNGAGGGSGSLGDNLVVGDWYMFEVVFTKNGGDVDVVAKVFESDANGVVGAQFGNTYTDSLSSSDIATDTEIYAGFRPSFDGQTDNLSFNQVPEPASLALMGLGGLLIVARRRKA